MPAEASYIGCRVRFEYGQARLAPTVPVPQGWLPAVASVVSPGTELRHLADTVHGPGRDAGYMTLARDSPPSGRWLLAPVPHGAAFLADHAGAVTAPSDTALEVAALARFQLMAALGAARLPGGIPIEDAVVMGSGPVALGCALELRRIGAQRVRVLTARRRAAISLAPGAVLVERVESASANLVIDAAGRPGMAAALVKTGGTLALLGTPGGDAALPAVRIHRGGWTVMGWHELADYDCTRYQYIYAAVAAWLAQAIGQQHLAAWCRRVPGEQAEQVFAALSRSDRPAEPVLLLEWTP